MSLAERIKQARRAKGWTQLQLADAMGVTSAAVSQWETGATVPEAVKLKKLAEVLERDSNWLVDGQGTPSELRGTPFRPIPLPASDGETMPVYAAAGAGRDGETIDLDNEIGRIERPQSLAGVEGACGIRVSGDSMSPRYEDGDTLILDPRQPLKRGKGVLVELDGRVALVKNFSRWIENGGIEVHQLNPDKRWKIPGSKIVKVYRIMWVWQG